MSPYATPRQPSLAQVLTLRLALMAMGLMLVQAGFVAVRDYMVEADFLNGYVRREARNIASALNDAPGDDMHAPRQYFGANASSYAFRVLDRDGRLIAGQRVEHLERLSPWSGKPSAREDLWLRKLDPVERMHVAGGVKVPRQGRDVWVEFATFGDPDRTFVWSIIADAVNDLLMPVMPLLLLTLVVSYTSVRRSLRPLSIAASRADEMSVHEPTDRLDATHLPAEAAQFAQAVNRLIDRVADLVAAQRLFIARAAHELRTPLSIMMLELGHLKDPNGKRLEGDVRDMSAIVDQLLSLARMEGTRRSSLAPVDISTVVRELVGRMLEWAEQAGHPLSVVTRRDALVLGDEIALRDAVRNLIENAVRHTPAGTAVRVEVAADGSVSVEDDGPGLDPASAEELKQPFRKGSTTSEGAGLGLAIVKQAAELHGGRLEVGRAASGGARFRIVLGPRSARVETAAPAAGASTAD